VTIDGDGGAVVYVGTQPQGQGHETAFVSLVSDALGISPLQIQCVTGDTELVVDGVGTFAARSLQTGGTAVVSAAAALLARTRVAIARACRSRPDEIAFIPDSGEFVVPAGHRLGWQQAHALASEVGVVLAATVDDEIVEPTYPSGVVVAVVEVDTETGGTELLRLLSIDDVGRRLFPALVDGQIAGGLAQGAAQALCESFSYGPDGTCLTPSLQHYGFARATSVPAFETIACSTTTASNPLRVKGAGEVGAIASPAAVQNAVIDAVRHLGVEHIDMPTTPFAIWTALRHAQSHGVAAEMTRFSHENFGR
jgi:carbon-monoxide dehydrogenase large subunit